MEEKAQRWLGVVRIVFGLQFLWAFFDKLFGLGYSTTVAKSWLEGGSPTAGFLKAGVSGWFSGFYHNLSGVAWVDWLFMLGLLLLGIAFLFGIGMRLATWGGVALMALMWSANFPPKTNPVIDDHFIYALTFIALAAAHAGDAYGFGRKWKEAGLVRSAPWLA
jgi:thiosulfate dehydrogenase [quinone] large subunit